ncbi:hypothetical protein COHA_008874 [Chlorella ohadii]|uniref:Chloroplast putative diflavin flavoprotein B n=1 Tax=Chlorella ohadii TaxID=2649997 RepID=A0A5P4NCD7_9CHLO|nr:hypothetical protein COHA_008874 [Chlorella ohadii]QFB70712.1 chloroplast putative diflavin flavoprotein B [Chlorella ohadii]
MQAATKALGPVAAALPAARRQRSAAAATSRPGLRAAVPERRPAQEPPAGQLAARASSSGAAAIQQAPSQQAPAPPAEVKYPSTLEVLPLNPKCDTIRVSCSERLSEVEFNQRHGTTTNAYLLKSGGRYEALIDVPSRVFDVDFVRALRELGATSTLRYIVITRLTPERLPVLARVLAACEQQGLQLLLSNPALRLLNERAEADEALASALRNVQLEAVSRGSEIFLSQRGQVRGRRLRFIPIPTPRWPDLLAVHSEEDNILFSSNFFSAHNASEALLPTANGGRRSAADTGGWDVFGNDWAFYYECMLAPVARQVATALDRLNISAAQSQGSLAAVLAPLRRLAAVVEELTLGADNGQSDPLPVSMIAPMHGPVVKQALTELVGRYADWTAAQVQAAESSCVAVLYASAYGNTASLAQAISHGITKAGVGVETLNLEQAGLDELERALDRCQGFVLGSPTLGGHLPTQVQTALGTIIRNSNARQVPCSVFGSFGWSGEAVDIMEKRLKDAGFRFAFDPIRCKFKPTGQTLQLCEESGLDLAQEIRKAAKRKEKLTAAKLSAAEMASGKSLAVARVLGALCVLTACDGEGEGAAEGAMLASWVSQASFDPPGLTVAVKRDRAMESLLPVGAAFVLNVLAEGREKSMMKQMLKPFKPAEDRFDGVEVQRSEATGAVIIPEAAAYLECKVEDRMDAGDHVVLYASVSNGRVLDDSAQSSVHYRKVGSSY